MTASFFSWKSGTKLQRSMEGLLRSLLHQVLKRCPQLIPFLFGVESHEPNLDLQHGEHKWSIKRLRYLFDRLLTKVEFDFRLVLAVDSLDELSGEPYAVVDILRSSFSFSYVKACLSSGPWIIFEDAFEANTPSPHSK